jgi:asparagine synthase (glutamine-hydrolysing)
MNRKGAPVQRELLDAMTDSLSHRGPDGSGSYLKGEVGLGHRRLSIIDLSGGAQPIANEDGTIHVVFNGEIYNFVELTEELKSKGHKFATRSDTEVIVHGYEEWGLDCVQHFNGIFAFVLWDSRRKQLFVARDHLGVKPLYYTQTEDRLLFASEIKALLADPACPRQVDLQSLSKLFTLRYVPSPDTMFAGIHKLPPGHRMTVDVKGIRIERYWNWTPQINWDVDEETAVEQYRELLEDAVRLQMRSDVPVGLFLSSGIDSGVLLAIMNKYSGQAVKTFTIGFDEGEASNETNDARTMAQAFGADHSEMIVSAQDYQSYHQRYLWDLEEPVGNESAAAFYFVSLIARQKVKVAFAGQGADEPWAGYPRYRGVKLSEVYSRLPHAFTDGILRQLVKKYSSNELLRRGVGSLSERDILTRFVKIYSFYSSDMKEQLFRPWVQAQIGHDGVQSRLALHRLQSDVAGLDPLTQMLYVDTRANLPDDLLMVGDKTSMTNSLEARVPFLDYRIVQFIETLPPRMKLRGFQGKYLHKKAAEKWLPSEIIHRKKKGFANPVDRWLRGSMWKFATECLLSESASVHQYFDKNYIQQLLTEHQTGRQEHLRHIYLLISFELWHQTFMRQSRWLKVSSSPLDRPQSAVAQMAV